MGKGKKIKRHVKAVDETIKILKKKRNGILKFLVNTDMRGNLINYSLAYINPNICHKDNGRVLGYDNKHGYHHKHFMGIEEKINFTTFEDIQNSFETEWREIHDQHQK